MESSGHMMMRGRDDAADGHLANGSPYVVGRGTATAIVGSASFSAVPPVSAYEAWKAENPKGRGQTLTATQLRRVALMVRNGYSWADVAGSVGRGTMVRRAWEVLPEHLRPVAGSPEGAK